MMTKDCYNALDGRYCKRPNCEYNHNIPADRLRYSELISFSVFYFLTLRQQYLIIFFAEFILFTAYEFLKLS